LHWRVWSFCQETTRAISMCFWRELSNLNLSTQIIGWNLITNRSEEPQLYFDFHNHYTLTTNSRMGSFGICNLGIVRELRGYNLIIKTRTSICKHSNKMRLNLSHKKQNEIKSFTQKFIPNSNVLKKDNLVGKPCLVFVCKQLSVYPITTHQPQNVL